MLRCQLSRFICLPFIFSFSCAVFGQAEVSSPEAEGEEESTLSEVISPELTLEQQEQACLRQQIVVAPANVTLEEIRAFCADRVRYNPESHEPMPTFGTVSAPAVEESANRSPAMFEPAEAIREAASNPFTLASHKTNYLLPAVYNPSPNAAGLEDFTGPEGEIAELDKVEVQFQLSVQVPIWRGFLGNASFLSVAYTNKSFWQAYNSDDSSPFRETNHEPELIMTWLNDWNLFGFQNVANQLVVNHQSNGRSGELSRSWNRLYANFFFERNRYLISFKPWYRIPESREEDDNPDIEAYLGHFELTTTYRGEGHSLGLMLRNNLRSDNHGAVELRWGFPIGNRVRGYIKYFNGYGESLIDYDEAVQTLGFGFELAQGFQ